MKMNIINFLIFVIVFTSSCENDDKKAISACGVDDPLIKIEWLKELKNNLENNTEINTAEIILYQKENIDYFYVYKSINSNYDQPNTIFDCEGNPKYACGGNQPVDSCSIFLLNAQKKETIWKK
jgi:hypothetical protein